MLNELIFVLLGGLLVWVGRADRFFVDPRRPAWIAVGALLVIWGVWSWSHASRIAGRGMRAAARIRGASLLLVGAVMISLVWIELRWTGVAIAAVGGILIARGLAGAALTLRTN